MHIQSVIKCNEMQVCTLSAFETEYEGKARQGKAAERAQLIGEAKGHFTHEPRAVTMKW